MGIRVGKLGYLLWEDEVRVCGGKRGWGMLEAFPTCGSFGWLCPKLEERFLACPELSALDPLLCSDGENCVAIFLPCREWALLEEEGVAEHGGWGSGEG